MQQFRCGQVHVGCDATFSAASTEEVLRQVTVHSWQSHSLHLPHLPASMVREVITAIMAEAASREGLTTLPAEPSMVDVTGPVMPRTMSVGPRSAGSWSLGSAH